MHSAAMWPANVRCCVKKIVVARTLSATSPADLSRFLWAISSAMTFLVADSAGSSEGTLDAWIGAVGLVVTATPQFELHAQVE